MSRTDRPRSLIDQARDFKDELSGLLNKTVCHGIQLTSVVMPDGQQVQVGYGITATNYRPEQKIGLTLGGTPAKLFLDLSFRLCMDNENKWLTVVSSFVGLLVELPEEDGSGVVMHELLHYDYERFKEHYTAAHVQVVAQSRAWEWLLTPAGRSLERLHLPVGGVRFRPTLEDVIEFVGDHKLADMRPKWADVVQEGRERFRDNQLRAAIRRKPELARAVLGEMEP